jgi:hypothetical protein
MSSPNSASSQQTKTTFEHVTGAKSQRELLNFAQEKFSKAKEYRQQFENQWYMNLAFYFGRHYLQWNVSNGTAAVARMFEPPAPPWRVRLVVNKIRAYTRKEMAKLTKENPTGFVVPQSSDDEDILAAQAGDHLAEFFWRELQVDLQIRRAVFWMSLTGTGFLKDGYDPNKKFDAETQGNCFCERVTPLHIFVPDVQEEEIENQPWVFHAASKSPGTVENVYGVTAKADSKGSEMIEDRFLNAMGVRQNSNKNYCYVKEMWIKPGADKRFKEGGLITWIGDQVLLVHKQWPNAHGDYPFTKIDLMPTGRFYSDSSVVDLIPLQKDYNRTRSQLIEAKNRMSKPQLIAPRGSVDPNKITSEPGLIIQYQPGFQPPEPLKMEGIPSYVMEELNRTDSDMQDISSQHAISRGGAPPGVHAAAAISYLLEQDDSILASAISSIELGAEKLTKHFLSYVTEYWDAPRQVQITGQNAGFEVYELDKNSLGGNTNYVVQAGSATPRSTAAKQAFIMELFKMGLVPPEKTLRYLEMNETGRLYEEMQVNARQAQRENVRMAHGDQPSVNTWDDHIAHLTEHDNYRKRQEYETLDPEIQTYFEEHVRGHKAFVLIHKGVPQELVNMALQDPSGMQLDSLLYQPPPGQPMPPGPGMGPPPPGPPKSPPPNMPAPGPVGHPPIPSGGPPPGNPPPGIGGPHP